MPRSTLAALFYLLFVVALAGCGHTPEPIDSAARCFAALDEDAVVYRPIDMGEPKDPRCRVPAAVRVTRIAVPLNRPAAMSCFLAERLDTFERDALQKLATAELGHRVVRIDHLGAYSCRANTGKRQVLSQHAYGLAIDISAFRLSNGEIVSVERDWSRPGPRGAFLHHLARAACGYFSVVLTPDSNADHLNHFHFDLGPNRLCSV
jgi:hypothetical protein